MLAAAEVNGLIYAIGGESNNSGGFDSLTVYDPVAGTWSTPTTTGSFTLRAGFAATTLNNLIYTFGGTVLSGYTNVVQVFNPATNTWTTPVTTGTFTSRWEMTSATTYGLIMVIGGEDATGALITKLIVFNPQTNTWTTPVTTGNFTPRDAPRAETVNGLIYLFGGNNPNTNTYISTMDVYDDTTKTWTTITPTGTFTPRKLLASAVVDNKIYAIGGVNASGPSAAVEMFDPATNVWSTVTTTGTFTPRYGLAAAEYNNFIHVFGGYNTVYLNTNEALTYGP